MHKKRDVFVQERSVIKLTCKALSMPKPPDQVVWRQNNLNLHLSTRGGIAIVTEKDLKVNSALYKLKKLVKHLCITFPNC